MNSAIFREYDIRGIAEKDLSASFAYLLGKAFVLLLKEEGVLLSFRNRPLISVGRDCRLTSDAYANALIQGLTESGVDVLNLGVCPSPLTYFSVFRENLDGAIMVTGSHNPAEYNGFKICLGKNTIHGEMIQKLRHLISRVEGGANKKSQPSHIGQIKNYPVIEEYWKELSSRIPRLKKKKIVLDAGNGTAATVAPELFRRLGADVIPLYCDLDGRFPNHHPDPTVVANLKDLISKVKSEGADFGIAFDGDSDRIGAVDETGRVLFGDELMVVFSRDVLLKNPGATIISEVKSSHRLYQDIAKHGGSPIMWKTGHSLIKSKMKETHALLAGEMSGHIFFADRYFGYDDAIYAGIRLYEIASKNPGPLSSLIQDLPPSFSTAELRVDCEEEKKFSLVEKTKSLLPQHLKTTTIDGVRADFGDGWGLLRASNTQPVLVLRFEASSAKRLTEIRNTFSSALDAAAKSLGHASLEVPT